MVKLLDGMKDLFENFHPSNFGIVLNRLFNNIHELPMREEVLIFQNFRTFFDIYLQEVVKATGVHFKVKVKEFNASFPPLYPPFPFDDIPFPTPMHKPEQVVDSPKEKIHEVFYEKNECKNETMIIFEVPGITKNDIGFKFDDEKNCLILYTKPSSPRRYFVRVPLSDGVTFSRPPMARLRNGLLELKIKKVKKMF